MKNSHCEFLLCLTEETIGGHHAFPHPQHLWKWGDLAGGTLQSWPHCVLDIYTSPLPSPECPRFHQLLLKLRVNLAGANGKSKISIAEVRCENIFCNPEDEGKNSAHFVYIQYSSLYLYVTAL